MPEGPEGERRSAARLLFALHAMVAAGVLAGQAYLFGFRALLAETALGSVDSALAARHGEEHEDGRDDGG